MKCLLNLILLIVISYALSSCKKELPPCSKDCAELMVSGKVIDKSSNRPIKNAGIKVFLQQKRNCLLCSQYKLQSGNTDGNGAFTLPFKLDTTLLDINAIGLTVSVSDNYISAAMPHGPGIVEQKENNSTIRFGDVDRAAMSGLEINYYAKTLLKINLHRRTPIIREYPAVSLDFTFDNKTSGWGLLQSNTNSDTTLTVYTAENMVTYIKSYKHIALNTVVQNLDSIRCSPGGNNAIDIYY